MPEGGKSTELTPGVIARVVQAARYALSGVTPDAWFGPMQPLQPMAPAEVAGRQFDYPVGYNLDSRPRGGDAVSFDQLRALADSCDILRSVIETRKDQMEAMDWAVRLKATDSKRPAATDDQRRQIAAITAFLRSPDRTSSWAQWLRQLLEDRFVIDAATLYKRRDRKGRLYALEIIDGATVKRLLDDTGRTPLAPDPAYQQVLKGIPAVDYTTQELLYLVANPRSNKVYGFSNVEQVIVTVNIAIRRAMFQLDYYREGSQPDAFGNLPKEWTGDQLAAFQKHYDSMMTGNGAARRRMKFMPGDFKYQETKQPPLKDEYDEWLARIICHVFAISPEPFVKLVNRATAETSHDRALKEGLVPLQRWVKGFLDRVLVEEFGAVDLEFAWLDDRDQDPKQAADINVAYAKAGIRSIDEIREGLGDDPLGGAAATPMVLTATGYVPLDGFAQQQERQDREQEQKQADPQGPEAEPGEDPTSADATDSKAEKAAYARLRKADRPEPIPFDRPALQQAEKALKQAVAATFATTATDVAAQINNALGKLAKDDETPEEKSRRIVAGLDLSKLDELAKTAEPPLAEAAADSGVLAVAQVGLAGKNELLSVVNEAAVAYARSRAAEMVGKALVDGALVDNPDARWVITNSTRLMLRGQVERAIADGWSTQRLANAIEGSQAFGDERATLIARTETLKASNEGNLIAYRASGVVVGKEWILGAEACDVCVENAEAGPIPLDDPFPSGAVVPPEHPNCRCSVLPVLDAARLKPNPSESKDA